MLKSITKIVSTITYSRDKFIDSTEWRASRLLMLAENKTNNHWTCEYSGVDILESSKSDIDHIVPLKYAWVRGANKWSLAKRNNFCIDGINLNVTTEHENRSKGDKGLTEYLPSVNIHDYVMSWERVCKKYDIHLSDKEMSIILKYKKER